VAVLLSRPSSTPRPSSSPVPRRSHGRPPFPCLVVTVVFLLARALRCRRVPPPRDEGKKIKTSAAVGVASSSPAPERRSISVRGWRSMTTMGEFRRRSRRPSLLFGRISPPAVRIFCLTFYLSRWPLNFSFFPHSFFAAPVAMSSNIRTLCHAGEEIGMKSPPVEFTTAAGGFPRGGGRAGVIPARYGIRPRNSWTRGMSGRRTSRPACLDGPRTPGEAEDGPTAEGPSSKEDVDGRGAERPRRTPARRPAPEGLCLKAGCRMLVATTGPEGAKGVDGLA
jgi:hypothetical protein